MNDDLLNPHHSIDAALVAIDRFHKDAASLRTAMSEHLRSGSGSPETRAFLSRISLLIDEFQRAAA
jgi:hypothetical protein